MAKKDTVDIILRIPKQLHAKAKKKAEKEYSSLNTLIVKAVSDKCNSVAKKDLE